MIVRAFKELHPWLRALPPERSSFLMKHVLKVADDRLEMIHILLLTLADWMTVNRLAENDDQQKILTLFRDNLQGFADAFEMGYSSDEGSPLPALSFGVFDERFAVLPNTGPEKQPFYDFHRDMWLKELPWNAITMVYCDLSALMLIIMRRLGKNDDDESAATKPGNPA